jgi:hypothetical protein
MLAFRTVVSMLLRELGDFSLHSQGRPYGRPPAALRPGNDVTVTGGAGLTLRHRRQEGRPPDRLRTSRPVIRAALGCVNVLLVAVAAGGALIIRTMLLSPTTARTPEPSKHGPDPVQHDGAPPLAAFQLSPAPYPMASTDQRRSPVRPCWAALGPRTIQNQRSATDNHGQRHRRSTRLSPGSATTWTSLTTTRSPIIPPAAPAPGEVHSLARNRQKPRISKTSELRRLNDSPLASRQIGSGTAAWLGEGVIALDR